MGKGTAIGLLLAIFGAIAFFNMSSNNDAKQKALTLTNQVNSQETRCFIYKQSRDKESYAKCAAKLAVLEQQLEAATKTADKRQAKQYRENDDMAAQLKTQLPDAPAGRAPVVPAKPSLDEL